jgi:endonuclease/exonuclease/phosphatase family metal-dependent hydrolase
MSNMYAAIRRTFANDPEAGKRCADRLIKLRTALADVRARQSDQTMLLATWNIRDFDSNKFGFGPRMPESFYYIAEIMSSFDLIAVQEVNRDLSALERVMSILGGDWDYIATDTTEGPGGNGERMAFVFNRDRVFFRKIAGEIVLPDGQLIVSPATVDASKPGEAPPADAPPPAEHKQQFARSPFLVAFQSGWFRFSLCTAHLYYGAEKGPQLERRIAEIKSLVKFFADRQDTASKMEKDRHGAVENYIVLGDFNVVSPEHQTMQALKSNGFVVPAAIDGTKVRREGDHFYDQIATRVKDDRFNVTDGGIVHMYDTVFTDADQAIYADKMPARDVETGKTMAADKLYQKWRTWQMSDHNPLWVEISTDFSDQYLQRIADGQPPE